MAHELSTSPTSAETVVDALLSAPEGLTRSQLSDRTGLSPATLVALLKNTGSERSQGDAVAPPYSRGRLAELLEAADESLPPRGGRVGVPPTMLRIRAGAAYVVGVDIGRRHVSVAVGDAHGRMLRDPQTDKLLLRQKDGLLADTSPWEALDAATDSVADVVARAGATHGVASGDFAGIGVSVASAIDPQSGRFRPGWLADDWSGIRLDREFSERLRARGLTCPLVTDKDANLGVLAEQRWGSGGDASDFMYVKWSHGISAGILVGGRLHRGTGGSAGAFEHTPLPAVELPQRQLARGAWDPDPGFTCQRCGKVNCLEAMIGGDRLVHQVRAAYAPGFFRSGPSLEEIKARARGDAQGHEASILQSAATRLGHALGGVVNLLNPEFVVIGGMFERDDYDLLAAPVHKGMRDVAIAPAYRDVDLRFSDQSVLIGTLAAVIQSGLVTSFLLERAAARPGVRSTVA
jgi:predicted NBD/HSP70 family sugar kinase